MQDYNPLIHPFELPVQKLIVYCVTDESFYLEPHEGSTPGTTLSGAYGTALWSTVCYNRFNNPCLRHQKNPECKTPEKCVLPWLYKPYSKVQHRNFTRPVLFYSPELEGTKPVNAFTIEITLWGRHAITYQNMVKETLEKMGRFGLNNQGISIPFKIVDIKTMPNLTLMDRIEKLPKTSSVLLEFQTPFLHAGNSKNRHEFHTDDKLPIANILGNIAYDLVAWDMEDRDLGETLDSKMRHNLARDARDAAWEAGEKLTVLRTHLSPITIGKRYSRGNKNNMLIEGFIGLAELTDNLKNALPWLLVLSLSGGGQKRAMGFGSVRLWLDGNF
ncbi:MAG: hypothetical protein KAH84_12470 [Thiomargarita sp.]|nr:hypothetical protein [Thiomargarita sp.]